MSAVIYDIGPLLHQAFALEASLTRYDVPPQELRENIEFYAGTRIAARVLLPGGGFRTFDQNGKPVTQSVPDLWLPPTTLVEYRRAKVYTAIQMNGRGTAKQVFALGDWELNIYGVAIDYEMQSAQEVVNDLLAREKLVDSLPIAGVLFDMLGVSHIFIEECEAKQVAGSPGRIPFAFRATSDEPYELRGDGIGADL